MRRVLAIDIGGSKLLMGCVKENGRIGDTVSSPLTAEIGTDGLTRLIGELAQKLDLSGICAAGVNIPGLADAENGVWVHAPFSGIGAFPIVKALRPVLGMPAAIENDVNACALAERRFGCCKTTDDYLWVTVSNGIGGSLVLGGELYTGAAGNAGEIGHFIVEEVGGFLCGCGRHGCLEAMAAGPGIARLYETYAGRRLPDRARSKEVGALARAGDEAAIAAFRAAGVYLGRALAYAVNLINPAKVVLGGGVTMDYDLWAPSMLETFESRVFTRANSRIVVEKTALGYEAALLGAATLALRMTDSLPHSARR